MGGGGGLTATTTGLVSWLLGRQVEVRGEPMANGTGTVGQSNQRRSLRPRARDNRCLPGYVQVERCEGARSEKKETKIPRAGYQSGDQDNGSDQADQHATGNVPSVHEHAAAAPGDRERKDVGENIGRRLQEICHGLRVAERVENL